MLVQRSLMTLILLPTFQAELLHWLYHSLLTNIQLQMGVLLLWKTFFVRILELRQTSGTSAPLWLASYSSSFFLIFYNNNNNYYYYYYYYYYLLKPLFSLHSEIYFKITYLCQRLIDGILIVYFQLDRMLYWVGVISTPI